MILVLLLLFICVFFNNESKIILKANEGNKVAARCHPCDLEIDFCGRRGGFLVRVRVCVCV